MSEVEMKVWSMGNFASFDRLPGAIDILGIRPGQRSHFRTLDRSGDGLDRLKVSLRRDGKAGLDDVHIQFFQLLGDPHLFGNIHRRPRRLFPIAKRGIKYFHQVAHRLDSPLIEKRDRAP